MHNDLKQMSRGCNRRIKVHRCYDCHGYRFRSEAAELARPNATTVNSGVVSYVTDDSGGQHIEYYGIIQEIVEISYEGKNDLSLVLFRCRWFNPIEGVRRTPKLGLVEINHNKLYDRPDVFILPEQVELVFFLSYPHPSYKSWWIVHKCLPHGGLPVISEDDYEDLLHVGPFQEQEVTAELHVDICDELDNILGSTYPADIERQEQGQADEDDEEHEEEEETEEEDEEEAEEEAEDF